MITAIKDFSYSQHQKLNPASPLETVYSNEYENSSESKNNSGLDLSLVNSLASLAVNLASDLMQLAWQRVAALSQLRMPTAATQVCWQVFQRTLTGNDFNESEVSLAERLGSKDRGTIAKALAAAVSQNVLEIVSQERGKPTVYRFKPIEEWQHYIKPERKKPTPKEKGAEKSSIRTEDTNDTESYPGEKTSIRTEELAESIERDEERYPAGKTSTNSLSSSLLVNKEFLKENNKQHTDSSRDGGVGEESQSAFASIWRRDISGGGRHCQLPPIYDQEVGVEIQKQMDSEGLTAQSVVCRAVKTYRAVGLLFKSFELAMTKFVNAVGKLMAETETQPPVTNPQPTGVQSMNSLSKVLDTTAPRKQESSQPPLESPVSPVKDFGKVFASPEEEERYRVEITRSLLAEFPSKEGLETVTSMLKQVVCSLSVTDLEKAIEYSRQKLSALVAKGQVVRGAGGYLMKTIKERWYEPKVVVSTQSHTQSGNAPGDEKNKAKAAIVLTSEQKQWFDAAVEDGFIRPGISEKSGNSAASTLAVVVTVKNAPAFAPQFETIEFNLAQRMHSLYKVLSEKEWTDSSKLRQLTNHAYSLEQIGEALVKLELCRYAQPQSNMLSGGWDWKKI